MASLFKWDHPTRFDAKLDAHQAKAQIERDVYAAVTTRDQHRCRCCGVYCNPHASTLLERAHHHHVVYRSAGGATSTANLVLICSSCHNDEHAHRIAIEGNADVGLTFSRRIEDSGDYYVFKSETAPHVSVPRD